MWIICIKHLEVTITETPRIIVRDRITLKAYPTVIPIIKITRIKIIRIKITRIKITRIKIIRIKIIRIKITRIKITPRIIVTLRIKVTKSYHIK